jgi:hypothetical protein
MMDMNSDITMMKDGCVAILVTWRMCQRASRPPPPGVVFCFYYTDIRYYYH